LEDVNRLNVKQNVSVNIYLKVHLFCDTATFFSRYLDEGEGYTPGSKAANNFTLKRKL
jgi:hypothetical protein